MSESKWWLAGLPQSPSDNDIERKFEQNIFLKWFEKLYTTLGANTAQRAPGVHVSDLVYPCARRGYYNALLPPTLDMKGSIYVWIGIELHKLKLLEHSELSLEWNGISGTVDEYENGIYIDIKTTRNPPTYYNRSRKEKVVTIRAHHLTQLEYYRVLLEENEYPVDVAGILYIDVNEAKLFPGMAKIHARELDTIKEEMMGRQAPLELYLNTRTLPPRDTSVWWMCSGGYCPHFGTCMRNSNPSDFLSEEYMNMRWSTVNELLDDNAAAPEIE